MEKLTKEQLFNFPQGERFKIKYKGDERIYKCTKTDHNEFWLWFDNDTVNEADCEQDWETINPDGSFIATYGGDPGQFYKSN